MSTGKRTYRARTFQSRTFAGATWAGVANVIAQSDAYHVAEAEALEIGAIEWQSVEIGAVVSQSLPGGSMDYEVGR